jgi:hypothetical protein
VCSAVPGAQSHSTSLHCNATNAILVCRYAFAKLKHSTQTFKDGELDAKISDMQHSGNNYNDVSKQVRRAKTAHLKSASSDAVRHRYRSLSDKISLLVDNQPTN